jgi:hypothetical protein
MRTLSLLTPGLFDALPDLISPAPQPSALLTLLARARQRRAEAGDSDALLLQLFGILPVHDADAPVAALSRLGETDVIETDGYWLRADPVHLHADQARLLLFGPRVLTVQIDEARVLAAAFNAVYSADGWRLETPHPQRWYLRLPDDPQIRTHPLHAVIGRNIDAFLPHGANGKRWHGVLNEVQMLFHDNPVNTAREDRGQLPINSVWFWGGGRLPGITPQRWTQVCSAEPFAPGLAVAAGVAVAGETDITAAWVKDRRDAEQLVVLSELQEAVSYSDADAWSAALTSLERDWAAPALVALQSGGLDALRLYPGNNSVYEITRADLRCFWRRRRGFDAYKSGI